MFAMCYSIHVVYHVNNMSFHSWNVNKLKLYIYTSAHKIGPNCKINNGKMKLKHISENKILYCFVLGLCLPFNLQLSDPLCLFT